MTHVQGQQTPFYLFYRLVARAMAPLVWRRVRTKLSSEGIAPQRQRERLGHATLPRPEGRVIWFHAASVGESVSALALIDGMLQGDPAAHALITSGTAASAKVLAGRLPARCLHQFAPIDDTAPLKRFLDHWRPEAGIFVESEIWPQMLVTARSRGIRLALVNARLSRTSLRNWQRFNDTFRFLFDQFDLIRTQDRATLDGLERLGADMRRVAQGPNLKAMILPPPVDATALDSLRRTYAGAPLWSAVSTHEGEEEAVLDAHLSAREALPGLRLILVPRHPTRADKILPLITARGLSVAQRSAGAAPGDAEVYLADTLGETGLWYALSPVSFLGGSFGTAGGHTPYEPALFATPVLHGPHVANFAETYRHFDARGAALAVDDPNALALQLGQLLNAPAMLAQMSSAATEIGEGQRSELAGIAGLLQTTLLCDAGKTP